MMVSPPVILRLTAPSSEGAEETGLGIGGGVRDLPGLIKGGQGKPPWDREKVRDLPGRFLVRLETAMVDMEEYGRGDIHQRGPRKPTWGDGG